MSQALPGLPSRRTLVGSTGALAIVCTLVIVAAAPQLSRPGYSPDEEFTIFAARGIDATGLPLLPSNWLYDRGVAYSYASWALGSIAGAELPVYRGLALVSAIAALVLVYATVARIGSTVAGVIALLLVATSIPFWAVATSGRFYAPFLLLYLSTLAALGTRTLGTPGTIGTLTTLTVLAFLSRLTHELAFTMAAIPLVCGLLAPRGEKKTWLLPGAAIVAGLVAAQADIFALHYFAPSSGDTMIRRFFLWQVLNLFETPPDRQFGIVLAVLVIAWLIAPERARRTLLIALCGVAFIVGLSLARALTIAPYSWVLVQNVLSEGSRYPLDMVWHIVRVYPVTIAVALSLLIARLAGAGGEWRPIERAAHLLWSGWVLWFGVIDSGITVNYLLLPITLILVAIAVDLTAILTHNVDSSRGAGRAVWWATCALAVAVLVTDQWRGDGSIAARLEAARPTIDVAGIDEIRDSLQSGDRVVCTDELGCLMLVGRIDVWLALDDFVRERFVVRKENGQPVGVYTGKPAVFRPLDLLDGPRADRLLVIDVFKEFPIGNSRGWLLRALARDGLDAQVLLESPHARVVEISPATRHAHR